MQICIQKSLCARHSAVKCFSSAAIYLFRPRWHQYNLSPMSAPLHSQDRIPTRKPTRHPPLPGHASANGQKSFIVQLHLLAMHSSFP